MDWVRLGQILKMQNLSKLSKNFGTGQNLNILDDSISALEWAG